MSFTPLFKDTEHANEVLFLDCEYDVVQSSDGTTWIRIEALAKDDLEYKNNGALFVINNHQEMMLLRYDFGCWLPIFPNDECPFEVFAGMEYITLSIRIQGRREYTIPIYKVDQLPPLFSDEILYALPPKLRTKLLEFQTDEPVHPPSEGSLPIETETEVCEEVEEVKLFTSAPSTSKKSLVLKYDTLTVNYCPIIEALLKPLNSSRLAIIPHETNSIIAYDVDGHLLLIGVCDLQGTWQAEEYTTTSNRRWWNTTDCELQLAPSPIYHLKHLTTHIKARTGVESICALAISSHMTLSEPIETIATWSPVKAITFENYEAPGLIQSNAYFKALKKEIRPTQPLDRVLIQTALSTYEEPPL